jgi:hypothetical protein
MKSKFLACLVAIGLGLTACGGGENTPPLTPVTSNETPPNFISYPDPNMFVQGVPITPLVPQITGGMPTNYLVQPDLPAGLRLDAQGRIVGTPTQNTAPATYIVTAGNSAGTTSFGVRITVVGRYVVGGTVSGLTGAGLVLTNNGASPLDVAANGVYVFPGVFVPGDNYNVVVATQPSGQTCTVTAGSGVIANSDYLGAFVSCTASSNKIAAGASTRSFEDVMRELEVSSTGLSAVACFSASSKHGDFILTLGAAHYELRELPGIEPPAGCGLHLVTLEENGKRVYVLDIAANTVAVYSTR